MRSWTAFFNHNFIEIQFTYHKIHPFEMCTSVEFSIFRVEQSSKLFLEYFNYLPKKPCAH